jgi:hypothetical protein
LQNQLKREIHASLAIRTPCLVSRLGAQLPRPIYQRPGGEGIQMNGRAFSHSSEFIT